MGIENTDAAPRRTPVKKIYRSFFTRKIERKLEEKEMDIPRQLINLMDVPFDDFSMEDKQLYETRLKPLVFVFAEHLTEVYEIMGRPRQGWEEMMERVEASPIKLLAALVIHQQEEAEGMEEQLEPAQAAVPTVSSAAEKLSVRIHTDKQDNKERWWGKKVF